MEIAGTPWMQSERNGATFYSAQPFGGIVPLHLAIAVSDQMMLAGSDAAAIEATLTRIASPARELEKSAVFRDASKQVPAGESAFNYVDTRLLFERADAALRPLLLMGAAFSPALGKNVDPAKLPPPEAITKHLSPIVMSQRYEKEGYVTESLGPVTFRAGNDRAGRRDRRSCLSICRSDSKAGGLLPASPANSLAIARCNALAVAEPQAHFDCDQGETSRRSCWGRKIGLQLTAKMRKVLRFFRNMLSCAPYGHPKEECFFTPSAGSRYGRTGCGPFPTHLFRV